MYSFGPDLQYVVLDSTKMCSQKKQQQSIVTTVIGEKPVSSVVAVP